MTRVLSLPETFSGELLSAIDWLDSNDRNRSTELFANNADNTDENNNADNMMVLVFIIIISSSSSSKLTILPTSVSTRR